MERSLSRPIARAVATLAVGMGSPAIAGGGPHVVDDASVELPGTCHVETWVTRYGRGSGLVNVGPACTREAWPNLEIGAALQHSWDKHGYTSAGPGLKFDLRPHHKTIGMAISGATSFDTRSGHLDSASLIAPLTFSISRQLRFSTNIGYSYLRASKQRHSLFWGGQLEAQISRDLVLMAEGFGRASGPAGAQAGLRWTPHGGAVDFDLLSGRYVDGTSPTAITIGITVRR